jgi:hypothetical protein
MAGQGFVLEDHFRADPGLPAMDSTAILDRQTWELVALAPTSRVAAVAGQLAIELKSDISNSPIVRRALAGLPARRPRLRGSVIMQRAFLALCLLGWLLVAHESVASVVGSAVHDFGIFAHRQVQSMLAPLK